MKHYALEQWIDFARGLVPVEAAVQMRNHLAGSCANCRQEADFWARLTQVCRDLDARRLGAEKVPESVIRLARAIFDNPARKVKHSATGPQ